MEQFNSRKFILTSCILGFGIFSFISKKSNFIETSNLLTTTVGIYSAGNVGQKLLSYKEDK